uniref:Uncharacterized protein n=1 Tax=Tanacetum cinerariifolium TaxID=118510 RepID=A0A6L2LD67_TANCI|nr:hypothetical protein [Tanacetum cinerariifolium]
MSQLNYSCDDDSWGVKSCARMGVSVVYGMTKLQNQEALKSWTMAVTTVTKMMMYMFFLLYIAGGKFVGGKQ